MARTLQFADGFKQYSRPQRIADAWISGAAANILTNVIYAEFLQEGNRRVFQHMNCSFARRFPANRRVCFSAIMNMTVASSGNTSTKSAAIGLLPEGTPDISGVVRAIEIYINSNKLYFNRQSYNNASAAILSGNTQVEIATLQAGVEYRIEAMIDHSDVANCRAVVYVNGSKMLDITYAAQISSYTNNRPFEAISFGSTETTATRAKARISDIFCYTTDAPNTDFPFGRGQFEYLNIQAALPFPPSDTDAPIEISGLSDATWELPNSTAAGEILGAVGFAHVEAGQGLETVNANYKFETGGVTLAEINEDIPPGLDRQLRVMPLLPKPTKAQIDAMQFKARRA